MATSLRGFSTKAETIYTDSYTDSIMDRKNSFGLKFNTLNLDQTDRVPLMQNDSAYDDSSWFRTNGHFNPSMLPIEHQLVIERIVNIKMAENTPILVNYINSLVYNAIRSSEGIYVSEKLHSVMPQQDAKQLDSVIHDSFADVDFIRQVSYADLGQTLHLILIHENSDFEAAFDTLAERALNVEELLSGKEVVPLILHMDVAEPRHLIGTKTVLGR